MTVVYKDKEGRIIEVHFTGNLNDAIDIDKVVIDGVESEEEIPNLEARVSEAYYGV